MRKHLRYGRPAKKLGFDKVFDFTFAADLTIVEETTEFLSRIQNKGVMPQFTSCCPGWINSLKRDTPNNPSPVHLQITADDDGCNS